MSVSQIEVSQSSENILEENGHSEDIIDNRTGRRFVFTCFIDQIEDWEEEIYNHLFDWDLVKYGVYQLERCPSTGREHLQGYFESRNPVRPSGARRFFSTRIGEARVYIRRARLSREENKRYCTKESGRLLPPIEKGGETDRGNGGGRESAISVFLGHEERFGFYSAVDEFPSTYVRHYRGILSYRAVQRFRASMGSFRSVEVFVFCGDPGTGKTREAYDRCRGLGIELYPLFSCNPEWWDGYTGQRAILIDDYGGDIQFRRFLRILDGHPLILPIKNGFEVASYDLVFITCNLLPCEWYTKVFANHPICYRAMCRRFKLMKTFYSDGTTTETNNFEIE